MDERTEPDEATHVADESDADRTHEADRSGTAEEERAAEEAYSAGDPEERRKVAEHEARARSRWADSRCSNADVGRRRMTTGRRRPTGWPRWQPARAGGSTEGCPKIAGWRALQNLSDCSMRSSFS
jgi:hypothetical protein